MSPARAAASLMASIFIAGTLTACGGSDRDDTYVRGEEDRLMTLTIDGDEVTHEVTSCDEEVAEEPSIGEIAEDGTGIVWTQSEGDFSAGQGTFDQRSTVTISKSAVVIPYTLTAGGSSDREWSRSITYVREGTPQADAVQAAYAEECA